MLRLSILIGFLGLILASCSYEPEPINFGHDECYLCKMTITEQKYGAELINKNGKNFKFDAIECMAKFINDGEIDKEKIHSLWTVNYTEPGMLIDAEKAFILRSKSLPSPMAMFLTSFSKNEDLEKVKKEHPGDVYNWNGVLELVKKEWE